MNKNLLPTLLVLVIITGGIFGYVYLQYGRSTNTNTTNVNHVATNTNVNTNLSDAYPENVIDSYLTAYMGNSPTTGQPTYDAVYLTSTVVTPFNRAEYRGTITPYGVLFWKKGPTKTTTFETIGNTPMEYEGAIKPDFHWYDFRTKSFSTLPTLSWNTGTTTFDRVYDVHPSITEPRILIEIGEYNITSDAFEPGLVESQPVKTRGVIVNPRTLSFVTGDPIQQFTTAIHANSTLFRGFRWDSKNHVAVTVPGGEGCGAYDSFSFVTLNTGVVTKYGGAGTLGFTVGTCNPRNAISPDGKWVILFGNTSATKGQAILYSVVGTKQQKIVSTSAFGAEEYIKSWDTTKKALPSVTTAKNLIIDFNL